MGTDERCEALPFPFPAPADGGPPPQYATLRETDPICRIQLPQSGPAWLVTRYDDIATVFLDRRFERTPIAEVGPGTSVLGQGAWLTQIDTPAHVRARRLLQPHFAVHRVKRWRTRIEEISDQILTRWVETGPPGDIVGDYAFPALSQLTCELLGVSTVDHDRFRGWGDILLSTTRCSRSEVHATADEVAAFLCNELAVNDAMRGDALLSVLVNARDAGTIDDGEMTNLAVSLFLGGFSTPYNMLAKGILLLLLHPDQYELLRAEPHRISDAVQEILRHAVAHGTGLDKTVVATEDVELSGVSIAAGERVLCPLSAANHDPARFSDPGTFDITRINAGQNVAFGIGRHACPGASLGVIQLESMIGRLIHHLPNVRLAEDPEQLPWSAGLLPHRLEKLMITWD
jgi:cytochrome P450